jgi:iron complex transport system substrate-binding protein
MQRLARFRKMRPSKIEGMNKQGDSSTQRIELRPQNGPPSVFLAVLREASREALVAGFKDSKRIFSLLAVLLVVGIILTVVWLGPSTLAPARKQHADMDRPARILSMAPNITEIVFALGLGDRLVGVTRYCDYPPAAREIARVGGYVDPNHEAILSLRPDLVILLSSQTQSRAELTQLGLRALTVPHRTTEDVHDAIRRIGSACGAEDRAKTLLDDIEKRTAAVTRAVVGRTRPRVLMCIGRDTGTGQLGGLVVAGRGGFHDEIIRQAGGVNACRDEQVEYPQLSAEGVIRLNPEVIVDLVTPDNPDGKTPAEIRQQWSRLRTVKAVGEGRVYVIVGRYAFVPGPRYVAFLEELARLLHPQEKKRGG